jgi:hypothetical protein
MERELNDLIFTIECIQSSHFKLQSVRLPAVTKIVQELAFYRQACEEQIIQAIQYFIVLDRKPMEIFI